MSKFKLRRLGVSHDSGFHQPTLQDCLEAVLERSEPLMDDVLTGLDASLTPVMGQTATIKDAATREAIAALCKRAAQVRPSYAAHLRQMVMGGGSQVQPGRQAMHFDDFQFLDSAQLDANIEAAHSLQSVMMAVEEVLPRFNAMMSNLMGWSTVQAQLNPLRPEAFSAALRACLEEFIGEPAIRSRMIGVASGLLGQSLSRLYREVIEWLRSQGVEPVHMTSVKTAGLWNPKKSQDSTVTRTMLTLDKLRRLLCGELDPHPVPDDRVDFAATIPASLEALQDLKLVEPMMKRLSDRAVKTQASRTKAVPMPVVDMLDPASEQTQRRHLGEQLGREVVLLMLENLMKDRRLLPQVRASLQALEPVLIELSQNDGRFFSERHHPARQFLDRMTHRSLAFANEAAPGYAAFQKTFDNAVRVLSTAAAEAASFARILRKIEEDWSQEEGGRQQRAAEAARGLLRAEQRNLLARNHSKQFAERMANMQVPHFVAAFVRGPWAQVVAEAQLNLTDGSVDPGGYQALVDELLWSVQPQLIRNNPGRLLATVPEMLVTLRRGLGLISFPQERMSSFFDALISFHEKILDGADVAKAAGSDDAAVPVAKKVSEDVSDSFWMAAPEVADSGYMDAAALRTASSDGAIANLEGADRRVWQVDRLTTGAWVDLMVGDDWVRAQLTWASPQRTLFLFISGKGTTHSMSRHTLDKLKEAGRIRLVTDARVMDRALDAVAQAAMDNELRTKSGKEGE
ncbi:DUF1631 family protein [Rhodoferax sp. GW822-FHT02A01]|uniref:DUF1631 family protein n=1 Tax=Rhodoferax sp. GW822-FHT02A01 TaxID=3141537 RepID=UPI00315CDC2A